MHGHKGADQVARALGQMGWEGFEAPLPSAVVRILRRWPGVLLDVGANTGFYSLIAVASGPDTTAIAYEPVPAIVEMLRANLRLNRASGRVTVEELAIGDRSGRATLHLPPPQPDGTIETSASLEPDFKEVIASSFEVRTSTLDDAWRASGEPAVTMVKVDVEGAEARVLRGRGAVISTCRPVVSIEVLGAVDTGPLEEARVQHRYVDVTLAPAAGGHLSLSDGRPGRPQPPAGAGGAAGGRGRGAGSDRRSRRGGRRRPARRGRTGRGS